MDIIYMTYRPEPDSESSDRPALEIEITPEMIEAGVSHLFEYDPDFDNEREVVQAIFRAMLTLSR